MAEELKVVLKRSEDSSFGFSLLGTAGLPHVIYDILENSPAAECGVVEAGDVIVKVNETDVHRFTTKEVLKCLRLSQDPVTLLLKRDPKIKAHVQNFLDQSNNHFTETDVLSKNNQKSRANNVCQKVTTADPLSRPSRIPTIIRSPVHSPKIFAQTSHDQKQIKRSQMTSNGSTNSASSFGSPEPTAKKSGFEAYMMTGDLILNLSRTQQSSGLITSQTKKVDSLRDSSKRNNRRNGGVAPYAKGESSPSSPSISESSDSFNSMKKPIQKDSENSDGIIRPSSSKDNEQNRREYSSNSGPFGDVTNELNGCVTSSSSSTNYKANTNNKVRANNDSVDSALPNSKINSLRNLREYQINNTKTSSSSSSSMGRSGSVSSPEASYSVPTSPTSLSTPVIESLALIKQKDSANSVPTSPETGTQEILLRRNQNQNGLVRKCDAVGFRTSRSEDHLQHTQHDTLGAVVSIDIDEDMNSSLNTLLDTRQDSEDSQSSDRDRIVWTYNAPVTTAVTHNFNNSHSFSSSVSSSPQHSDSLASPTSVSSSVISSNSGSRGTTNHAQEALHNFVQPVNGTTDPSVSEAVSNISSPDYQDDDNILSSKDIAGMAISDPSDSDSTILISERSHHQRTNGREDRDNKIVIKVKGVESPLAMQLYMELKNSEDELATLTEDAPTVITGADARESSPPVSDDGSDVESLHSYHYSPKAVDIPSAVRLAKRLYGLEGFKKSDVSRHLSKNNDFSRAVADEYLRYFNFEKLKLDEALRQFLQQFSLSGETQERERVLVHFSKRYLDCNPGTYNSQDAVHTLTCAIMLLNTDLHGQNIGRKMTCSEFILNLAELNDGENFPKDILKYLYQAIKDHPLEWAFDDEPSDQKLKGDNSIPGQVNGSNSFLDTPQSSAAIEYKKGYVMRKCCYDSNNKKTPFGKRSWKMFYCTLRDLVLYLHKDEHGFRKSQMSDNVHNAIRIHHALATKAIDYTKKQHVFRLQTADQSEFLFQTSDSKELESWISTINYVCAAFSAPPLDGGVGSHKPTRFQRPLLPTTHSKLLLREQLQSHENKVSQLEELLSEHKRSPVPTKGLPYQNYTEKENYLQYELKRYRTYATVLGARMAADEQVEFQLQEDLLPQGYPQLSNNLNGLSAATNSTSSQLAMHQTTNRYGNRSAIYRTEPQQDIG